MNKVDWRPRRPTTYVRAKIGSVTLKCHSYTTVGGNLLWYASVSLNIRIWAALRRQGKTRRSLSEAKNDAVRLACELLVDHQVALTAEMRNFDLAGE